MADFVAVLRKTIDALGENTPQMREKVFDKARATIEAKLKAMQPAPPQAVIDRQRKALEDAIVVIKADYEVKTPEKDDTLEDIFASLKTLGKSEPPAAPVASPPVRPTTPPVETVTRYEQAGADPRRDAPASKPAPASGETKIEPPAPAKDPVLDVGSDDGAEHSPEDDDGTAAMPPAVEDRAGKRFGAGLIAAAVVLVAVAAGGYAVWLNRSELSSMVGLGQMPAEEETPATTADDLASSGAGDTPEADAAAPAAGGEEQIAAVPPAEEPTNVPENSAAPTDDPAKFTQRLLPDGTEVDEGPADGPSSIGEGTSMAAATQPASEETATDASPAGAPATPEIDSAETERSAQPESQAQASLAVGQKAIFYEERTTSASGSAEAGSIVWSLVEESPGGDLPPEPAIRAQATIPGKDIQLRMTIRRNGDRTLPASHIIEMIFLTPDGFEGGGIANVSRISFKETEQAAGNALIGIPAKIADGFFLIALGDAPAEVETNTTLLRRQSWIDIPLTYQSGRRALLSMEKGIPGDKVFQEALRAWAEASSG